MKKTLLSVVILLLFSVSWGSAYALDDGYKSHEVDAVQTDALASLYDKSTATIDSDSSGGAVDGRSINQPVNDIEPTQKTESYASRSVGDGTDFWRHAIEQTDYGSRYNSTVI